MAIKGRIFFSRFSLIPRTARSSSGKPGELSRTERGCGAKPGEREGFGAGREIPEANIFPTRKIRDRRRIALGSLRLLSRDDPPGLPELVPDAVDQGLPGGFDDVMRDTHGPPP